jgi:hypothetical protein
VKFTAWQIDVAVAVVVALILIFATPGLAITALLALLVLVVCGVTLAVGRMRSRRRFSRAKLSRSRSTLRR